MMRRILLSSASAMLLLAVFGLPELVHAQTTFGFNVVANDGTFLNVMLQASTTHGAPPSTTVADATIDIEYDASLVTFLHVDAEAGVLQQLNGSWYGGCTADALPVLTCAQAIPYSLGGEALNDGTDYVRVTILPTHSPNPSIGDTLQGGTVPYPVDGYELGSSTTDLLQLDFTVNTASQARTVAKTAAPVPVVLTIRPASLAFGFFDIEDNTDHSNDITNCPDGCNINNINLPVELTDFSAVAQNGDVVLTWGTASETNNAGFSVEHAAADGSFQEVAFVDGAGTSLKPHTYTYTVKGLDVGTQRFRLKQVDFDGSFKYSNEVETTIGLATKFRLGAAYPNPFNPSTTFELVVARKQHVKIDIINALGQRVERMFDGDMEANKPTNFTFRADDLPSGLYFYRVVGENFAQTRQMLLVK